MKPEFDAKDLVTDMNMTITVARYDEWRFRLWLGLLFIRLGAWIAWIGVKEEVEPLPEKDEALSALDVLNKYFDNEL